MRPTLVVNPSSDAVFAKHARLIAEHGVTTVSEFQRRLRLMYPLAVVHDRLLSGERYPIFYLYRDGRWVRP